MESISNGYSEISVKRTHIDIKTTYIHLKYSCRIMVKSFTNDAEKFILTIRDVVRYNKENERSHFGHFAKMYGKEKFVC